MNNVTVPGRHRFLASDFLTLQGLSQVAVGLILLLVHAASELNNAWDIWLFPAAVVLIGIASWRVGVYYERRFGHVEPRTRPGFWGSGQPFLRRMLFWVPAMLVFLALPKIFNISPAGLLLGLVFVGLFVTENRPWYYLLFSLPFFIMAGVGNTSRDEIRLVSVQVWLIPLALIVTGILDHLRLVQSFPGLRSNGAA
jgi:hypothetical protein